MQLAVAESEGLSVGALGTVLSRCDQCRQRLVQASRVEEPAAAPEPDQPVRRSSGQPRELVRPVAAKRLRRRSPVHQGGSLSGVEFAGDASWLTEILLEHGQVPGVMFGTQNAGHWQPMALSPAQETRLSRERMCRTFEDH
ncbi:hypothetical protein ACFQX7_27955 [Luedemannella flava]